MLQFKEIIREGKLPKLVETQVELLGSG